MSPEMADQVAGHHVRRNSGFPRDRKLTGRVFTETMSTSDVKYAREVVADPSTSVILLKDQNDNIGDEFDQTWSLIA